MKKYRAILCAAFLAATFLVATIPFFAAETITQPASQPDRIILSWADDCATTQSVTWRTSTKIGESYAELAESGVNPAFSRSKQTFTAKRESVESENVKYHSHAITFTGLKPGTMYCYRVGQDKTWSEWFTFTTGSQEAEPFLFLYFGDAQTGMDTVYPRLVRKAFLDSPEAKFAIFAGDLVNTGSNELQWDQWFNAMGFLAAMYPIMPVPGNHEYGRFHDNDGIERRGLTKLWRTLFTLPENGPDSMKESSYTFVYNGVRFVGLDSTQARGENAMWLENVLKNNISRWTIVYFHHPIYSPAVRRDIPEWRRLIKPILDKYQVDLALQGHDHIYTRTGLHTPHVDVVDLKNANEFDPQSRTVYVTSVAGDKMYKLENKPYFVKTAENTQLFQTIAIDGDTLTFTAKTAMGDTIDYFVLDKSQSEVTLKPHDVHVRVNVAHRGASVAAPENTLAAYRAAIEAGADGAECDVYRSADGVVFLSHDPTPKRTMGGGNDNLTNMTFEQIRQFDAGSWKGEQFKGEKVPSLDEFMKLLKGTSCHPVIEIKQPGIEADVIEIVRSNKMVDESTIIAFDAGVIREIRRLEPKICAAWLYSEDLKNKGTAEENAERLAEFLIGRARELDNVILDLNHGLLSPKLIQLLNAAGIHVWTWTVNDAPAMERYLDWGVVSITTDRPELLTEILKRREKE